MKEENKIIYILIAAFSVLLSSIAQVLLKKSALKKNSSIIAQYLNKQVIFGYGITGICMILSIIALSGMPYKLSPVIETTSYIYIMLLSYFLLKEKITKNKLVGNIIIIIGIIIFNI